MSMLKKMVTEHESYASYRERVLATAVRLQKLKSLTSEIEDAFYVDVFQRTEPGSERFIAKKFSSSENWNISLRLEDTSIVVVLRKGEDKRAISIPEGDYEKYPEKVRKIVDFGMEVFKPNVNADDIKGRV